MDKQQILDAALRLAENLGYQNVFRRHVADELKVSEGIVSYYWPKMSELRDAIVHAAIAAGNRRVVLQAIAVGSPLVDPKNLNPSLRKQLSALKFPLTP